MNNNISYLQEGTPLPSRSGMTIETKCEQPDTPGQVERLELAEGYQRQQQAVVD